ncbi:MAG TPA: GNAT family N-acetyltransferase [Bacteroidia bacterium]|jgi:hypothetical protein
MIVYREHKEINKKKWDDCVNGSPEASVFALSFYLDAVADNWSGLVLDDYEAVFPIVSGSKYRIRYIYQPFFTRYFGVFSKVKQGTFNTDTFLNAIPDKFRYMEFCLHEKSNITLKELDVKERKYQLLGLNLSYEDLYKSYSENAKRSIKKAVKEGFVVKEGIDPKLVVDLFRNTKGQELEVFSPADYKKLLKLMDAFAKDGNAVCPGVYSKEGELVAAGFFMRYGNRYVFLKSGVTDIGKAKGAMHLLFDNFIRNHSNASVLLDFGGSSVESVARFYKNFGAKDCVYLQVKKNRLPGLLNWIKSLKR